jgi:positive phototaxis protein PixI
MPHLPPAVMGVYNWRGEILWIVDLAKLLGHQTASHRDRSLQPTIAIDIELNDADSTDAAPAQKTIGLLVDEIFEIEWWNLDLIQSPLPDRLPLEIAKWSRSLGISATGEECPILNLQEIFGRSATDRAHRVHLHADI